MRRRLYLMRHGSVSYFTPAGQPVPADTVPLNPQGILQARAAGQLFAANNIRFDRVITSGLPRTEQTAQASGLRRLAVQRCCISQQSGKDELCHQIRDCAERGHSRDVVRKLLG